MTDVSVFGIKNGFQQRQSEEYKGALAEALLGEGCEIGAESQECDAEVADDPYLVGDAADEFLLPLCIPRSAVAGTKFLFQKRKHRSPPSGLSLSLPPPG